MIIGQINRNTLLGDKIYNLVKQSDITNIVEIGTWNGMGSTKCVIDGLIDKTNEYYFLSLESNKNFFDQAVENLKEYSHLNILLKHGRIIDVNDLINLDNVDDSFFTSYKREIQKGWLFEDIKDYNNIDNVIDIIPEKIDLLILDGGEFSSMGEFHKLKDKITYVILDDTMSIKNYNVRSYILNSSDFLVLDDNTTDRHGYLIAKKII